MKKQISAAKIIKKFMTNKEYNNTTPLCAIMTAFGSDKATGHNYTSLYSKLFDAWKDEEINLLELGLGTNNPDVPFNMGPEGIPGASLYGWAKYFPKGHIYGADIDKRILFNKGKIKTYYCDSGDEKVILDMYKNTDLKDISFDIIVEDGFHEFKHNLTFLYNSLPKVKKGGIFIIEDLNIETMLSFKPILPILKDKFLLSYIDIIELPFDENRNNNNNLLIIQK